MSIRALVNASMVSVLLYMPTGTLFADEPVRQTPDRLKPKVQALIGRLDADTRKERVQSVRELLQYGPAILPLLPSPGRLPNAMVRDSVRRIRVELETRKARKSVLPSRMTIDGLRPIDELLDILTAKTKNRIDYSRLPADWRRKKLRIKSDGRTFWSILDEIVQAGRLRYVAGTDADVVALAPAKETTESPRFPVAYSGPFRLAIASVRLRRLFGDEENRRLSVRFHLTAEPRLRPLFMTFSAADVRAVSPAGERLASLAPLARYELPFGERGRRMTFNLAFKVPKAVALPVVSFVAKLTVLTAAGEERIVFRKLADARGVSRRRGGVRVRIEKIKRRRQSNGKQQASIRVGVVYDIGGPAFESHRTWMFHNNVFLETGDGRRILHRGQVGTFLQTDGAVAVEYQFDDLEDDWGNDRFVYMAPTLLIRVPIEIKLSGVSLDPFRAKRKQP